MYLVENNLVYIVQVPLVMYSVFIVLRVILFHTQVKDMEEKFTLIQPEKVFILTENIACFYAKL